MTSRRRLGENVAALMALQVISYIAPLITVPYLVRTLGPAQFGLLSFAQAIALNFDLVTDYAFNLTATRAIAGAREVAGAVSRVFWSTLFAKCLLMLGSGIVLALLVAIVPSLRQTPALFAATFLLVVGTTLFPVWLFQGLEELKLAAIGSGVARALTIPALLIWIREPEHYVRAAVIQSSVQIVATLLAFPILWKRARLCWHRPSISDVVDAFRGGCLLFVSEYALFLCNSSVSVILGFTAGRAEVGYFSAADKLIKASTSVISPFTQALFPHITAVQAQSHKAAVRVMRKSFFSLGIISLIISIVTLVFAGVVCRLLLGPAFLPSVQILRLLSPMPFLFGLMAVLGTNTMVVLGMDRSISRIILGGAAIGIPLNIVLCRTFEARGAAIASVATATAMVLAMIMSLRVMGLRIWSGTPRTPSHKEPPALFLSGDS
jgi:PST family polysaccharide transporter